MIARNTKLGLAEAAQVLGIPYQQAHRLLLVGVLPGEKLGGRWYVASAAVRRLVNAGLIPKLVQVHNTEVSNAAE